MFELCKSIRITPVDTYWRTSRREGRRLTGWLSECLTDWLGRSVARWQTYCLAGWLAVWVDVGRVAG